MKINKYKRIFIVGGGVLVVFAFIYLYIWAKHNLGANPGPNQAGHKHGAGYAKWLADKNTSLPEKLFNLEDVNRSAPVTIKGQLAKEPVRLGFVAGVGIKKPEDYKRLMDYRQRLSLRAALPMQISFDTNGELTVSFDDYPNSKHKIKNHLRSEPALIEYLFYILSPTRFYTYERGDYVGLPQYRYFDGEKMIDFTELIVRKLGNEFAKDKRFPQFKLDFSDSFIRFEEIRYCCEALYEQNNPQRQNYRKVFILNRENLKIIKEENLAV